MTVNDKNKIGAGLRILFGMPAKGSWGGPIYCEPPFVAALRTLGVKADEEDTVYGESGDPVSISRRIRRVLDAAFRLRRRTRSAMYDLIHLNTSFDKKSVLRDLAMILIVGRRVPYYLKMHGSFADFLRSEQPVWQHAKQMVFRRAAMIGVLSNEERVNFIAAGCPPEKLHLCKYVVETVEFKPDPAFRERHDLPRSATLLLFSGRFIPAKGLLTVIDSVAKLRSRGSDVFLICLGDGPDRTPAEQRVRDLDLSDIVRFTGYIPEAETAGYHANCDIFVLPTAHDEGFPLVIVKSLAAGMAVITTAVRGAADHLVDGVNTIFVPPSDPEAIADAVERIARDPQLKNTMRTANQKLSEEFASQTVAMEYIGVYRTLIN